MGEYLILKLTTLSFLFSTGSIIALKPLAVKMGLTDEPCARKHHHGHIPLVGGIAVFFSIAMALLSYGVLPPFNFAFLLAGSLLVLIGVIDDYKNINIVPRFIAQIFASLIMIYLGDVQISSLGNLLGFGEIQLGAFAVPFTVFAVVGGINAFNMIDGIDGLAGSLSLVIFLILAVLCDTAAFFNITLLSLIFIAAIAGFLLFNLRIFGRKASVFLGDTGSTLFGFSICWFLITASQGEFRVLEPATVLWIIALPLMDTVGIMIRRIHHKRSPFAPDREHLHHIFPLAGFSVNATLAMMVALSVLLAMFGVVGERILHIENYLMFYLFLTTFALYFWGMCHAWKLMKMTRKIVELSGVGDPGSHSIERIR